jgi:hypothetical protein
MLVCRRAESRPAAPFVNSIPALRNYDRDELEVCPSRFAIELPRPFDSMGTPNDQRAKPSRLVLRRVTSDVVAEYLRGTTSGLAGTDWAELRARLLVELLSRCPGFSTREYRVALTTRLAARGIMLKVRHALASSRLDAR